MVRQNWIAASEMRWLPSPFTDSRCTPIHVFVEPEKERPSLLEGLVVGLPGGDLVLGREGLLMPSFYRV